MPTLPLNVTRHFRLPLQNHPYVRRWDQEKVDFAGWVCTTMGLDPSTPTKLTPEGQA